jgi:hypothetical protein
MIKRNIAASVRTLLFNHACETKQDFDFPLIRFCLERLVYWISATDHSNYFRSCDIPEV